MLRTLLAAALSMLFTGAALAQQLGWVQIEARPTEDAALDRAGVYASALPNVNAFSLPSGWFAIALGPYDPVTAEQELRRLRAAGAIPGDSFVSDGRGFGRRVFGAGLLVQPTPAPDLPPPLLEPEETVAQSRAAERQLTRSERAEIQEALQWEGFYTSTIDAAFGPGTRRAMGDWQLANGFEPTGILSTAQRRQLIGAYREVLASLGMRRILDSRAGIEIDLPTAMVSFARHDPPFAFYDAVGDSGVRVLLISQSGDEATLFGLYDIMQTLEIVPLDGPRERGRRSFTLTGANDDIVSTTYAEVAGGAVKGFTLIWPAGDEKRRTRALQAMRASFTPTDGVLPDLAVATGPQGADLLSGLRIRQPERSRSGFFVSPEGHVATSIDAADGCARVTFDGDAEARLVASDPGLGVALLEPTDARVPMDYARFQAGIPRLNSEVAVAGFPYGGALSRPVLTFGTLADLTGLSGEEDLTRLALVAEDGDAGGPVFDASGSVLGLLLPRETGGARQLPPDVSFAADAVALATFLSDNGVTPAASDAVDGIDPVGLSAMASGMTVLVSCWN